jgi:Na+/H+ antiporter NhaA
VRHGIPRDDGDFDQPSNDGIAFDGLSFDALANAVTLGVGLGLLFGKLIGVFGVAGYIVLSMARRRARA